MKRHVEFVVFVGLAVALLGLETAEAQGDPVGACCYADCTCRVTTPADCQATGGIYQGDGTGCDPLPCPCPTGACCYRDGHCVITTPQECSASGGTFLGFFTSCYPNPCVQPTGACCLPDGSCLLLTQSECDSARGTYQGDGSLCGPQTCQATGTEPITWGRVKHDISQ